MFYPFYRFQFLDELIQFTIVFNHQHYITTKESIVRININGTHRKLILFRDNIRDIAYNSNIIIANDSKCNGILACSFSTPFRLNYAIAKAFPEFWSIRTIIAMDSDTAINRNETENIITINWMTTLG